LYVVVGGIQWRLVPHEYPKWQSVYSYFRTWKRAGVWKRTHDELRAQVRRRAGRHEHPTGGCLDSQSVKTTAVRGSRGFAKAKLINGRKRHVLVDSTGLLLAVSVTAASVQDPAGARQLLGRLDGAGKKLRRIWVDGGYRGQLLDWVAKRFHFRLQVVLRPHEHTGFTLLPRRWVVERTFAWFSQHRRLSKDYEGQKSSSEAMIYIVMIRHVLFGLEMLGCIPGTGFDRFLCHVHHLSYPRLPAEHLQGCRATTGPS
jgi:putative transposase